MGDLHQEAATPITGELQEAASKYGRKYGWLHWVLRTEFRGTTPRNSPGIVSEISGPAFGLEIRELFVRPYLHPYSLVAPSY